MFAIRFVLKTILIFKKIECFRFPVVLGFFYDFPLLTLLLFSIVVFVVVVIVLLLSLLFLSQKITVARPSENYQIQ